MCGQVFLPSLFGVHLGTLSEAVAIGVDTTEAIGVQGCAAGSIFLHGVNGRAIVDAVLGQIVAEDIPDFRIKLGP